MEHDNLCTQQNLDEETLVETLKTRFNSGQIYTNSGLLLLLLNPYKNLDIDSSAVAKLYKNNPINLKPHVYALLENVIKDSKVFGDHSIIISGESGSGKTECAKRMLKYLDIPIMHEVDLILESFGNAKTVNNDNSSRFGKLIRIHGNISISTFLLEKSRVTSCNKDENNFHIFYYILASRKEQILNDYISFGMAERDKDEKQLQNDLFDLKNIQDVWSEKDLIKKYHELSKAFEILEIDKQVVSDIIMGIIYLGSIKITESGLLKDEIFYKMIHFLDLDENAFEEYLLFKVLRINDEVIRKKYNLNESITLRDSIARIIYSNLFDYIVKKINEYLLRIDCKISGINILDIFGFENFEHNGLDQFCINWCNEKIYDEFVNETFLHQKEILLSEGVVFKGIFQENGDNETEDIYSNIKNITMKESRIPIIEKKCGIVDLISEESFINGNSKNLSIKLEKILNLKIKTPEILEFDHFAGKVSYDISDFIKKNKEKGSLSTIMSKSLQNICTNEKGTENVVGFFKNNLNLLFSLLKRTKLKYIKCIRPNSEKKPMVFDKDIVMRQLLASGILQSIEISKYLFPYSLYIDEFEEMYPFVKYSDIVGLIKGKTMYFFNNKCFNILEVWKENIEIKTAELIQHFGTLLLKKFKGLKKEANREIKSFTKTFESKRQINIKIEQFLIEQERKRLEILEIEKQAELDYDKITEISETSENADANEDFNAYLLEAFDRNLNIQNEISKSFSMHKNSGFNDNPDENINILIENETIEENELKGDKNIVVCEDNENNNLTSLKQIENDKSLKFNMKNDIKDEFRENEPNYLNSIHNNSLIYMNPNRAVNFSVSAQASDANNSKQQNFDARQPVQTKLFSNISLTNEFKGFTDQKSSQEIINELRKELSKYKSFSVSCSNCQILQQKYKIQSQQLQKKQTVELELEKIKKRLGKYEDTSSESSVEEASVYNVFGCLIQLYLDHCPIFSNKDIPKDEILSLAHSILFLLKVFDETELSENLSVCLDEINKRLGDFENNISMVAFVLSNIIELKLILKDIILEKIKGFQGDASN